MNQPSAHTRPLVVDLDGTLIRSNLLHESALGLLRQQPLQVLRLPGWLAQGKAPMKAELAARVALDATTLPYQAGVLAWLRQQKQSGRRLVLATASDQRYAQAVAQHLGLFDEVLASDGQRNLAGPHKRAALVERYGERGYDYVGNAPEDVEVWSSAECAWVVSPSRALLAQAAQAAHQARALAPDASPSHTWIRALRGHQWLKNALVFVPLLAAHQALQWDLALQAGLAFAAFCLTASSVYLLNDLLDLADDRHHRSKRQRPFAAGHLTPLQGVIAAPLLLLAALGLASGLRPAFLLLLSAYYVLTLLYSFWLKRQLMVDVLTLATLYTLRIVAGAAAVRVMPSFWLLAFSMFIFLSLALLKRYTELIELKQAGRLGQVRGRGYQVEDLGLLVAFGAASGYAAVLVLALYLNSHDVLALYHEPRYLWLACPALLHWISRAWLLAHRGLMHDDPVVFAAKDRTSQVTAALTALLFWLAL